MMARRQWTRPSQWEGNRPLYRQIVRQQRHEHQRRSAPQSPHGIDRADTCFCSHGRQGGRRRKADAEKAHDQRDRAGIQLEAFEEERRQKKKGSAPGHLHQPEDGDQASNQRVDERRPKAAYAHQQVDVPKAQGFGWQARRFPEPDDDQRHADQGEQGGDADGDGEVAGRCMAAEGNSATDQRAEYEADRGGEQAKAERQRLGLFATHVDRCGLSHGLTTGRGTTQNAAEQEERDQVEKD